MRQSHIPSPERQMPADFYGRFDIKTTPDGGKQYSIPHTLNNTAKSIATSPAVVVAAIAGAAAYHGLGPIVEHGSPLGIAWLHVSLLTVLVLSAIWLAALLLAAITGKRKMTRVTIREDGLIINDAHHFQADHIWDVSFGITHNKDKPEESVTPFFEITLGTKKLMIADGIDLNASLLFERLLRADIRRYWHRHN